MTEGGYRYPGDSWRWSVHKHPRPTNVTIAVIEHTPADDEAARERDEKKRREGAQRVPFGFARAVPAEPKEPILWEGDNA